MPHRHKIETLPKWEQTHIRDLNAQIRERDAIAKMHAILSDAKRDWFVVGNVFPGPRGHESLEPITLWSLRGESPHAVCSISPGDLMFVGRAKKEPA